MTNEKEWWEEYLDSAELADVHCWHNNPMEKIVAEAMRRGEVKAWEEIVERVESLSNPFDKEWLSSAGGTHHAFETARSALLMEIDEKRRQLRLKSLT